MKNKILRLRRWFHVNITLDADKIIGINKKLENE